MKQILRDIIEFSVSHCLWSLGVPERGYLQALSRIQSKVAALQSIIREQMQSNQRHTRSSIWIVLLALLRSTFVSVLIDLMVTYNWGKWFHMICSGFTKWLHGLPFRCEKTVNIHVLSNTIGRWGKSAEKDINMRGTHRTKSNIRI